MSASERIGYTETIRMNDYVGPPLMADVTWDGPCEERPDGKHLLGRLTDACVTCKQQPAITYLKP